jgi:MYXO-CTERM domain-containing protein
MSALPQALPLALSAAVYPPALLVLLMLLGGQHPRRLVLAFYGGAAILTIGAVLSALAVLDAANLTTESSKSASGWTYILIGVLLLALAAWAWRRRARDPNETPEDASAARRRIAE